MRKILLFFAFFTVPAFAHVVYDFEQDLDGWSQYSNSTEISAENGCLVMRFADVPEWEWYPYISSPSISLDADEHPYFALKVKAYKVPAEGVDGRFIYWTANGYGSCIFHLKPGEQIIRFQPAAQNPQGQPWAGTITGIRFDIPLFENTSYQEMADAEIQIDWLALSNSAEFIPAEEDGGQFIILDLYDYREYQEPITNITNAMPNNPKSNRKVGIGVPIRAFASAADQQSSQLKLQETLSLVESNNIPICIYMDTEHFWQGRPEMWNWWDPDMEGYDPTNVQNVEWCGWSSADATKVSWLNWGTKIRKAPIPNFMSPQVKDLYHSMYGDFIPIIVNWWNNLPESKKDLFVGFKVGWESGGILLLSYFENGNYYVETWPDDTSHDPWGEPMVWLGYNALQTAGIKNSGTLTYEDVATVTGLYNEYLSQLAQEFGLPRHKIFTWSAPLNDTASNEISAVNDYSSPGWSRYTDSITGLDVHLKEAMETSTASFWAHSEGGIPYGTVEHIEAYFDGMLDPRCKFMSIFNYWYETPQPEVEEAIRNIITPSQFCIQDAIDSAANGDTIVVPRGIYYENLDFGGKSLTLISENPDDWDVVNDTVIDAKQSGSAVNASFISGSGVVIKGFTIQNGYADNGGAIYAENTNLVLANCILKNSAATTYGGGIYFKNSSSSSLTNVLIADCSGYHGGAIYAYGTALQMNNITIADNTCDYNYRGAVVRLTSSSSLDVSNSILWGNNIAGGGSIIAAKTSTVNCNYNDIEGGQQAFYMESGGVLNYGMGNLDVDPDFADASNYQLNSQAGVSPFYSIGFIAADSTSKCIDRANPSLGLQYELAEGNNKRRNLGVYGGTAKASKTPVDFSLFSDVNNDDIVNVVDFSILAESWMDTSSLLFVDFNRDGEISILDLFILSQEWLSNLN
jgi:hypothetical protein